jgi:hypothetical protein
MCTLLHCTGQNWPFYFPLISYAAFTAESMKIILDGREENGGNPSNRHRINKSFSCCTFYPFPITAYITWCIYLHPPPPPTGTTAPSGPGPPHYQGFVITLKHSVGLLWTSDQPIAEISTWQHTTLTRDRHLCTGGIRNGNPRKRSAADPRLRRWSSGRI